VHFRDGDRPEGHAVSEKVRAQPIGISAAPNMTGQARGEGGKDGRPLYQSATALFVPFGRRLRFGNTPAKYLPIWITTR
jgi:hypothetical protein